jgi:hypothetical protein
MTLRFCCICCEDKDINCFYFVANKDGLTYQCKECLKEYHRERNKKKGYYKKYYNKQKNKFYYPTLETPTPSTVSAETPTEGITQTPSYSVSFE